MKSKYQPYLFEVIREINELAKGDFRAACQLMKERCDATPPFKRFVGLTVKPEEFQSLVGPLHPAVVAGNARKPYFSRVPRYGESVTWDKFLVEIEKRLSVDGIVQPQYRLGKFWSGIEHMVEEDGKVMLDSLFLGKPSFDPRLALMVFPEVFNSPKI